MAQAIPVNEEIEADSTLGDDDTKTDYTSLKSSIFNYNYSNGRRYHAFRSGSYWGPNDEKAMEHLDLGHHVFSMILGGKSYLAPIGDDLTGTRILDVGTGTGIWAIDVADQHPGAIVIGTDLSPIQPTWLPPNCSFEISDCTDEWDFREQSFDFIHVRGLYGCITDWPTFYQQVYKTLKPGGYIEQVEQSVVPKSDDSTTDDTIFEKWGRVSLEAGDKFGKTLRTADEAENNMKHSGLQNVVQKRIKVPIGPWAKDKALKELGSYNRLQWEEGIEGWAMYLLTAVLGWSRSEVELYLMDMRQGLADRNIHAYQDCTITYGQRPENSG